MKKRILSILLLCCMVLTLLPTAAFAEGEIPDSTNVTVTFDSNGGGEVKSQTIPQGQPAQRPDDHSGGIRVLRHGRHGRRPEPDVCVFA